MVAVQEVLDSTGARAAVERRIEHLLEASIDALEGSDIAPSVRGELVDLAVYCCRRDR